MAGDKRKRGPRSRARSRSPSRQTKHPRQDPARNPSTPANSKASAVSKSRLQALTANKVIHDDPSMQDDSILKCVEPASPTSAAPAIHPGRFPLCLLSTRQSLTHTEIYKRFREQAMDLARMGVSGLPKHRSAVSLTQLLKLAFVIEKQTPSTAMSFDEIETLVLDAFFDHRQEPEDNEDEQKLGDLEGLEEQEQSNTVAATRLAKYLNGTNALILLDQGDWFDPDHFLELEDFTLDNVIGLLEDRTFSFDENIIRGIMRDPIHYKMGDTSPPPKELEVSDMETTRRRHSLPPPDDTNVARQPIKEAKGKGKEWFEMIDGKLYIIYERVWTGADGNRKHYRQQDETRAYNPLAPSMKLSWYEKDSEIIHPGGIRTFDKKDNGVWNRYQDNGAMGKWVRAYAAAPNDKSKAEAEAEPKLIARKYHRETGAYLELYEMGESWAEWERKVENFDINNRIDVQAYNRWINQIRERYDFRHNKRAVRPCWTSEEITALRCHFNDLIEEQGLIVAHQYPNWKQIRDKVAEVGKEKRAEDSVASMAERDIFVQNDERMGIHEWREFGRNLLMLRKANPDIAIPKNVLFPGRVIPMDNIKHKQSGSIPSVEYYNPRRDLQRYAKLEVKVINGRVMVEDRLGGKIVERYGLMNHHQAVTNQECATEGKEDNGDADEDRSRKPRQGET